MLTPIVLVLLDGLGGRPHPALGGRTAGEAAPTPVLDAFTDRAVTGLVWPLGPGLAPSSELAHWVYFLGALDAFPGRAVLEARGHGLTVGPDEVIGYAALRPGTVHDDGTVLLGRRPGSGDAADCAALFAAISGWRAGGLGFGAEPVAAGQAILRLTGGASPLVTDTEALEPDIPELLACQPADGGAAAAHTAGAVNQWAIAVSEALRRHPVNTRRARQERDVLGFVTVKWWGRHRPAADFTARTGLRGAIVSEAAYQGGLAATLGMAWRRPAARPAGGASIAERLRVAGELLDEGYDFVHVHDKAADEAGHTKDPQVKMRMIASLDRGLAPILTWRDAVVIVTGDHATPAGGRMLHSGDAVPVALAGPSVRPDPVQAFGERPQAAGWLGRIAGADILPLALNAADRARFLGGRATAARDVIGRPATWQPLRVTPSQPDRNS